MRLFFIQMFLLLAIWPTKSQAEVRILTVPFSGDVPWTKPVSIALNLRVFAGLRGRSVSGKKLPSATVIWNSDELSAPNHQAAIKSARRPENSSVVVIWGKIYDLPGEVAVTTCGALPSYAVRRPSEELFERWQIKLKSGAVLTADVTRREYRFKK